jgi:hypothetical protein
VLTPDHPFRNLRANEKLIVLQLRDDGTNNVRDNLYVRRVGRFLATNAVELAVKPGCEPITRGRTPGYRLPRLRLPGRHEPVGARPQLRGRENILLDEWGPWDHESPLLRPAAGGSGERLFDLFGVAETPRVEIVRGAVTPRIEAIAGRTNAWRLSLSAPAGVAAFEARVIAPGFDRTVTGTLVVARWDCVFFPWKADTDPREHLDAWRNLATAPEAVRASAGALDFPYGWGGPRDQAARLGDAIRGSAPGGDHFGMIARTRLALPKGAWRVSTLSDDGIRVTMGGRRVIENWTWHGPTGDEGTFEQASDGEVDLEVEHFEIDGYSVLRLEIEPAGK